VASVLVTQRAVDDLRQLVRTLSLPRDTADRVRRSIEPLTEFPLLGPPLTGRWEDLRFVLGPWRWLLVVYRYDEQTDEVVVLTILDARSSRGPRSDVQRVPREG
jgi:plasmid stabilization system protein ParE